MANRIFWQIPISPDAYQFEIRRAAVATAPLTFVARIPVVKSGSNWDSVNSRFFYDDPEGDAATIYQVLAFAGSGDIVADSGPFQPALSHAADLLARTRVDHNYGGTDQLRYVSEGGDGIPNAEIRVYKRADYDQGRTDLPLFRLETDNDGRWVAPVFLEVGFDYTLWYAKSGLYGPNLKIITV
jgi:hypothetical protein